MSKLFFLSLFFLSFYIQMSNPSPYGPQRRPQNNSPFNPYQGHNVNFNTNVPNHPSPYHRGTTNINRSKSLTRPERQRPRTGMINRNPSQPQHRRDTPSPTTSTSTTNPMNNQPMSSNLQQQLQQQKRHQQHQSYPHHQHQKKEPIQEEEEKEPKVLTNWWAWIAFLCTCCFPNYIIRVWFGKSNKNMQQAWREKVYL